jgi:IclR family pca regulon transcriptional regulator
MTNTRSYPEHLHVSMVTSIPVRALSAKGRVRAPTDGLGVVPVAGVQRPDAVTDGARTPADGIRTPDFVQSLERGLAVIRAFDADHPQLTLSDVARATGLTRAAARRFLLTLVELGYVRTDGRQFSLRPRVLELGYAYLSALSLPEVALPHLEALAARVHESSSLSVLDGEDVVYVARVPTKRIMTVAISVGTRFPAYATSMGRVLLADRPDAWLGDYLRSADLRPLTRRTVTDPEKLRAVLTRVRGQGFALVDQELEEGLRSLAVPVRGEDGRVVAAVNVSAHASRGTSESIRKLLLPPLQETARRIEEDLRGNGRR